MFKYEVSVYFDINPSDYLLESYDVDASLKDKLKCLVFIPIISRTYCDSKSFAWEQEFKAFVEQASHDHFGLKIKLPNGNVASRVLPVRIHDLDPDDLKLCESVLGGVLRGVEFIYKEPGVNRSLSPKDHEEKNLNNTNYRNQINKVALAIKEIISGLKTEPGKEIIQRQESLEEVKREEGRKVLEKPYKQPKRKVILGGIFIAVLLVIAAIFAYPKIFKKGTLEELRSSGEKISIVVMPFQNLTNDTTWNVWQDGIQENLISYISNSEELQTIQAESVNTLIQSKNLANYASLTPSFASEISKKLDANVFIYGNIQQAGDIIRVNAKLIDSQTEEIIKSFQIEGPSKEEIIFHICDSLSRMVRRFLIISNLKKDNNEFRDVTLTSSPEAYKYYILGKNAYYKRDIDAAIYWLNQSLKIDSNFTWAMRFILSSYKEKGDFNTAKEWCRKWYEKRDRLPDTEKLWVYYQYSYLFQDPKESVKYVKQLVEIDNQNPYVYFSLGLSYQRWQKYDNAIIEYKKALNIFDKWGSKPTWILPYSNLGYSYFKTGHYKEAIKLLKEAELDFPDNWDLVFWQAILSLTVGDTATAKRYIEKYISIAKKNFQWPEAAIDGDLAAIYSQAGILDKAEEYYRKALSLDPENRNRMNSLGYFLIDKDVNINEGLELAEKVLKLNPDAMNASHNKGWALYKQGKYQEALVFLQKGWDLRMKNVYYDHTTFLHLEAAKKAVAGMK